ncbi:MAG: thaumatin family protein [Gammaproteobacteria bacterium]
MKKLGFYSWIIVVLLATTVINANAAVVLSISNGIPAQTVVGSSYPTTVYTFKNTSSKQSSSLTAIQVTPSGNPLSWKITCNGNTIGPNASCQIIVGNVFATNDPSTPTGFTPTSPGSYTLSVSYKVGNSNFNPPGVNTTATGTTPPPPATAKIEGSVTPPSLDPEMIVGQPPVPITFQFINNGKATARDITVEKKYPPDFAETGDGDTCSSISTLDPGKSCVIQGTFTPKTVSTPPQPQVIAVTLNSSGGNVKLHPQITVNWASVTGKATTSLPSSMKVGDSASVGFRFTNNSKVVVDGIKINEDGSPSGFKLDTDNCSNKSLTQSGSDGSFCDVTGTFTPATTGDFTVYVNFTSHNSSSTSASASTHVDDNNPAKIEGKVVQPLPDSMTVGQSALVDFQFTNTSNFAVQGINIDTKGSSDNATLDHTNCSDTLDANGFCDYVVKFTPVAAASAATVTANFSSQNSNRISLTSGPTKVVEDSVANITGSVKFEPSMVVGDTKSLYFHFINVGTKTAQGITVQINDLDPAVGSFKVNTDTCIQNDHLDPNQFCDIQGDFTAKTVGTVTLKVVTLKSNNGGSPSPEAKITVTNSDTKGRVVSLVNNCPFPVWVAFATGSVLNKNGQIYGCTTDDDCHPGSVCHKDVVGDNKVKGQCFWKAPVPKDGNYKLDAKNGANTVFIPTNTPINSEAGTPIQWNGGFVGRTGCESGTCETATCGETKDNMACTHGITPPATQAEITFQEQPNDFYDLETIDGFNIPVEISPNNAPTDPKDPAICQAPGSPKIDNSPYGQKPQLSDCNWEFNFEPRQDPSNFLWVKPENNISQTTTCTTDSQCNPNDKNNPTFCGMALKEEDSSLYKTCGKFLGYWTLSKLCDHSKPGDDIDQALHCSDKLPEDKFKDPNHPTKTFTNTDLYLCRVQQIGDQNDLGWILDSCFFKSKTLNKGYGEDSACCGCVNWDTTEGGNLVVPQSTTQCAGSSQVWKDYALPNIRWLKKACPTSYAYPFDDTSSTYVCSSDQDPNKLPQERKNIANYTVTFCPADRTGQPTTGQPKPIQQAW